MTRFSITADAFRLSAALFGLALLTTPATAADPAPAVPATMATTAAPAPAAPAATTATAPAPATPTTLAATSAPAPAVATARMLPPDLSPLNMFLGADIVVKLVIILLGLASVITWTIWLAKTLELRSAGRRERTALAALDATRGLSEAVLRLGAASGPVAAMAKTAHEELRLAAEIGGDGLMERVQIGLARIEAAARRRAGQRIGILATIGATAPFVGLFGTVWGIMNSFVGIARTHTTNLAVVAPGIAEALLATAAGLVAAIPAVVVYNLFVRSTADYRAVLGDAGAEVLAITSRDLGRRVVAPTKAAE